MFKWKKSEFAPFFIALFFSFVTINNQLFFEMGSWPSKLVKWARNKNSEPRDRERKKATSERITSLKWNRNGKYADKSRETKMKSTIWNHTFVYYTYNTHTEMKRRKDRGTEWKNEMNMAWNQMNWCAPYIEICYMFNTLQGNFPKYWDVCVCVLYIYFYVYNLFAVLQ